MERGKDVIFAKAAAAAAVAIRGLQRPDLIYGPRLSSSLFLPAEEKEEGSFVWQYTIAIAPAAKGGEVSSRKKSLLVCVCTPK